MLAGFDMSMCPNLAVSAEVMQHVVQVESGANPFAIGVVGGQLVRQPANFDEAVATVKMLDAQGYDYSLGVAQVNRRNLQRYGLDTYAKAFDPCGNLQAGATILAECYGRSGQDWGKAFSCYYSGNFTTGYRHGYVQNVFASWQRKAGQEAVPIPIIDRLTAAPSRRLVPATARAGGKPSLVERRIADARDGRATPSPTVIPAASDVAVPAPTIASPQAPAVVQAPDAPVMVQPYYQNTAVVPQVPPAMQISGRDDAFVF